MFLILQLICLLLVSVILISFIENKKIAISVSALSSLFFTLQVASIFLGNNLVDYKFFIHMNLDVFKVKDFFGSYILVFILVFFIIIGLSYFASRQWHKVPVLTYPKINYLILPLCLIIMSLQGGVLNNLYGLAKLNLTAEKNFIQALEDLGVTPSTYTFPEDVKATAGKNIIVISMESLERGFLGDNLAHLTPNLRKMRNELTYFNMKHFEGSDWTAGSIYTEITGFPCYFKGQGNEIFQNSFFTKITGLGHILDVAGYDLTYMLAGADFAGLGDMLRTNNFNVKSDNNLSEKYPVTGWGIHDKDLFKEAKKDILNAKEKDKPFALFMSTISTHHPDGIYDNRMEGLVKKQKSNLEFMAASTDYLIGDLYKFLKNENLLENTTIYLFPDHLLMGKSARVLNEFVDRRDLYLITNAEQNKLSYSPDETIYQIDIPKIILEGANIKHNAKFLTDYLKNKSKPDFIRDNRENLLALNEASLVTKTYQEGIEIKLASLNSVNFISSNHSETLNIKNDSTLCELTFDENMKLLSKKVIENLNSVEESPNKTKLILKIYKNQLSGILQKGNNLGIAKQGEDEIKFLKEDIELLKNFQLNLPNFQTTKPDIPYFAPYSQGKNIFLTSTCYDPDKSYPRTEIRIGDRKFEITRGINLLIKHKNQFTVENYDTYGNPDDAKSFIERLKKLKKSNDFFAMVINDSGEKELLKYKSELKALGFTALSDIHFREAYVGYSIKGLISEYKHPNSLSFSFPQELYISSRTDGEIFKNAKDRNRFIAHAGGRINGYTYTNSLEALNFSYSKGFRQFELDIIETSDGEFVSAHDWKNWASQTNYNGKLPVSREEFLKHKIRGKFTPLDMKAINNWFKNHKDAILVTDKINKPKEFSNQFTDKNRLIMELFSMDAVKEGMSVGIKSVMVSDNVWTNLPGDKVAELKKLKVKNVCVSRRMIDSNPELLLKLKENGIKVYVYHINFDKGKDEAFAVLHDMDYIYGLYADDWSF